MCTLVRPGSARAVAIRSEVVSSRQAVRFKAANRAPYSLLAIGTG